MTQSSRTSRRAGPRVIAVLAVLLLILHQDYWFWTNKTLVLGILPMGLFWHVCISLAAALTWYLATHIAWPIHGQGREPAGSDNEVGTKSEAVEG